MMREPLSDDEVRRIARQTADHMVKRLAELILLLAFTLVAVMLLPVLMAFAVSAYSPSFGSTANPLAGGLLAAVVALLLLVVMRSWKAFLRGDR